MTTRIHGLSMSCGITADHDTLISRMPVGWPHGTIGPKQQITVVPAAEVKAGREYRIDVDLLSLTATITEVES